MIVSLTNGGQPKIAADSFVAPGAVLAGNVRLMSRASVWYNAVLRAETERIVIGERSNIQDNVSGHADEGFPLILGNDVSVGHNAVLHGCTVEDGALIGMHATVLNGAVIGAGSLVAAGALVPQGVVIPPGSLVAGVPGRVRRELRDDERADLIRNAEAYLDYSERHLRGTLGES